MSKRALGAGVAIALVIVVPLTGYGINKSHHNKEVGSVYEQAQDMAEQGRYAEA